MAESSFLAGKVRKRSLPVVRGPSSADTPAMKRLLLPQGELAQFYDGPEGMRYMAVIELRAGNTRGNHYHQVKEELVYVVDGEVLLVVEDLDTEARASVPLSTGDLVFIPTRIAHALQVVRPGLAIEFSAARFDPADIYRKNICT
jgi:uncharacterized RmlC-like cupin family protein